jgi:hypothetical protein
MNCAVEDGSKSARRVEEGWPSRPGTVHKKKSLSLPRREAKTELRLYHKPLLRRLGCHVPPGFRPAALRPHLSMGLPLSD